MAASDVDICNLALAHIAQGTVISSIDPPDQLVEADHCARFYPIARDKLLEQHAWKFAITRAALAELSNTNLNWSYCYALPNDCVRPLAVLLPESTDDKNAQPFDVESLDDGSVVLFTNVEDAVLKYIRRVTDPTKFSPLFISCFARLLAAYIAGPITKRRSEVDHQMAEFTKEFLIATGSDASASYSNYRNAYVPEHLRARGD